MQPQRARELTNDFTTLLSPSLPLSLCASRNLSPLTLSRAPARARARLQDNKMVFKTVDEHKSEVAYKDLIMELDVLVSIDQ
eukprot:858312-Rhodomonas_salina.1